MFCGASGGEHGIPSSMQRMATLRQPSRPLGCSAKHGRQETNMLRYDAAETCKLLPPSRDCHLRRVSTCNSDGELLQLERSSWRPPVLDLLYLAKLDGFPRSIYKLCSTTVECAVATWQEEQ